MRATLAALLFAGALAGGASAAPRSAAIKDPDTKAWWRIAEALSSDAMEGRDTGSAGYDRAADIVVQRFKAAGLKPAGDNGGWFQSFLANEVKVNASTLTATRPDGSSASLIFRDQYSVRAAYDLPPMVDAPLMWGGLCRPEDLTEARGKWVACLNSRRTGLTTAGERIANGQKAGVAGLIQVDDPHFTIEPARWPAAYARTVTTARSIPQTGFPVLTIDYAAAGAILSEPGRSAPTLAPGPRAAAPPFQTGVRLKVTFRIQQNNYMAKNVLAVLPGRDPKLKDEVLVLSAHLDGYGFGRAVNGDGLYNGTLDDAAYVGTLIRFADKHKGKPLRRSVLLAAFTGEEKGLLGAHWFVDHPAVPKADIVADLNLDQLRPLFPLKILTELAVDDTSLGTTARAVAATMGIRIQPDPEPERSLLTRADHWPFMQAGIPGTGFIFGYEPGTEAERRYREWYEVRYHRPQDDLTQPMDFEAAGKFNRFFYKLAETVADDDARPSWVAGSKLAPNRP